ncbi:Hypothetical protein CINCED_3A018883 [Cinara cedri]|uniref:Putative ionotropic receptor ligand binding domain-containing protein n=1 Tax=Cinara cedri TaxID=506608 RepID=A0A5E4M8Y1_9HEMI|nr:Hypothetical protein CINCED_3A018883 [Cinara cedri]
MNIDYQLSFFFTVLNVTTVFAFGLPQIISSKTHQNVSTTELFNCLSNVTRTYFDRQSIYLHFDEFGTVDYMANVDSFTEAVQSPKVIVPYSSFTDEQQLMKGVFAFLAEDLLYVKLLNITQQSYFLAVWTKQMHVNYIRLVFRDFWTYGKHINVVGLVMMDDGTVNAYTYKPFSNYGCSKLGRPFLLDNWQNGRFLWGVDLFSQKPKTGNMRGCELKCVGNEHPPDSVMRHDGSRWTTSGVGGKVLEILAKYLNFSPVITSPKSSNVNEMYSWYDSADVLNNISVMLITEEADLAFGWYSFATHKSEYNTKLARTTSIDCLGWAVPYRAGPPPKSWTNYVNEFDKVGWLFIGSMFVVVVGVFYFFRKLKKLHGVDSVVFFVYHMTIDQPTRVQPIWCSLRTFTIHWLWYCMVINVAYKASLGSFMTVPPHGIEFTRMDQILNSQLITMASPQSLQIINGTTTTTRISRTFMNRLQQLPPTNFEHIIDRLVIKRDIALFEVKRFMYYYSKPQAKRIKVKIPIRFLPGCLLRTHTTQFMLNGGSYLTDSVDALLSTLFETGIVDHWITHLGSNKVLPLEKIRGRVLKFVRLKEAFLFLFFSYGIAFVVLVGEICWSKRIDRRLLQLLSIRRSRTDCTDNTSITTPCRGPDQSRHYQSKSSRKTLPFVH